jgi:hypothetical protein
MEGVRLHKIKLWNGRKVIGEVYTATKVIGKAMCFFLGPAPKTIMLPYIYISTSLNATDWKTETMLDVRKLRKKQREPLLLNYAKTK